MYVEKANCSKVQPNVSKFLLHSTFFFSSDWFFVIEPECVMARPNMLCQLISTRWGCIKKNKKKQPHLVKSLFPQIRISWIFITITSIPVSF